MYIIFDFLQYRTLKVKEQNLFNFIFLLTLLFTTLFFQLQVTLGGLPLAVEDVNKNVNLLPGKTLTFTPFDIGKTSAYRIKPLR